MPIRSVYRHGRELPFYEEATEWFHWSHALRYGGYPGQTLTTRNQLGNRTAAAITALIEVRPGSTRDALP